METTALLQTIRTLQRDFQMVALDDLTGLSAQLDNMRRYFDTTAPRIHYGAIAHRLDPDDEIGRELENTGQAISKAYHDVRRARGRRDQAPAAEVEAFYRGARAAYAASVRLQWEIGEHDVKFIPHEAGHAAPHDWARRQDISPCGSNQACV